MYTWKSLIDWAALQDLFIYQLYPHPYVLHRRSNMHLIFTSFYFSYKLSKTGRLLKTEKVKSKRYQQNNKRKQSFCMNYEGTLVYVVSEHSDFYNSGWAPPIQPDLIIITQIISYTTVNAKYKKNF